MFHQPTLLVSVTFFLIRPAKTSAIVTAKSSTMKYMTDNDITNEQIAGRYSLLPYKVIRIIKKVCHPKLQNTFVSNGDVSTKRKCLRQACTSSSKWGTPKPNHITGAERSPSRAIEEVGVMGGGKGPSPLVFMNVKLCITANR